MFVIQISDNAEISSIIKILGLVYKKKYETMDDLKSLRYGRLMIMTDQDQVCNWHCGNNKQRVIKWFE